MKALSTLAVLLAFSSPASALNWEGHSDWFHEKILFEEFIRSMPPPLRKPQPTCAERQAAHARNNYEQIALPGVNCTGPKVQNQ